MTTDKEKWMQKKDLENEGWSLDGSDISIHSSDETPRHLTLKTMAALKLQRMGRAWECEVEMGDKGVVDILAWGSGGKATVYEMETAYSPERAREKADQYAGGMVRDVIVIPVKEAPESPGDMLEWLDGYIA